MNIGLIVFIISLFVGLTGIISSIFFKKFKIYLITISIIGLLFSFSSLLFLNIIPYTQNTFDTYKIEALKENIEYYNLKVKKYEKEDKKILEEWAKQQEEMAKKLSAIGIQFAGEIQPNNIIKKLSEEIQVYFKIIDEKQLEIYDIKGKVKARKNHKWFWGF